MTPRVAATRYARALLEVSVEMSTSEQVADDLDGFADLIAQHPELARVLSNPAVPVEGKRGVVQELLTRLQVGRPLDTLLLQMAEQDRLSLVPALRKIYRERLMDHQQVVRAEVTTATPLAPEAVARLQQRLSEVTGRRVAMESRVDASVIGGVVARVGSTVYDGSIATQLARMKSKLFEQA
ncbi:MAG: ATP synthase F1 subunit delta [Vicinamibacterales bacterium]